MEIITINVLAWASPLLILLMVTEFVYSKFKGHKNLYRLKDFLASSAMGFGSMLINTLVKLSYSGIIFISVYEAFNPLVNGVRTNILGYVSFGWGWYMWLICLVLNEFSHYWVHRLNHTVRFMWAAHIVHHSSEHYNYGTSLRLSWIGAWYRPLFFLWIPAIGVHPEMVVTCLGIEVVWQFMLHTSYCPKLGFLEYIFITPKQHQVHHAVNKPYLDKNHGAIFNIFDRLFGSWKDYDETIDIQYGVTNSPDSYNPIVIATHEYCAIWRNVKKANNLKEVLMYVFGPPGWSPDRETLTVRQIQLKFKEH